jgi:hypothetical protein
VSLEKNFTESVGQLKLQQGKITGLKNKRPITFADCCKKLQNVAKPCLSATVHQLQGKLVQHHWQR